MRLGNERQLQNDDLWELEDEYMTQNAFAELNEQYVRRNRSVLAAVWFMYWSAFVVCGFGAVVSMACELFAPVVLNYVITAFAAPVMDMDSLMRWLAVFLVSRVVNAVVYTQMVFRLEMTSLRLTSVIKALLFQKAMRRSSLSRSDADMVDISNLFATDDDNIVTAAPQLNKMWLLPIQIAVVIAMLYSVLGLIAFAGLAVTGMFMAGNMYDAKLLSGAFDAIMTRKDERMKIVKEVFGAI